MKTRHIILFFFLQTLCIGAFAQGYNNIWTFGSKMGLDFNGGSPTFFVTKMDVNEGTASVSDYSGNLLFYGNGKEVYDKTHAVMPNGSGLLGKGSTTQGIVITQADTSFHTFYVFTIDEVYTKGYLGWSLVDMRLRGGLGDVVPSAKNILLDSFMSEKMIVAGSCGNQWVITHHRDSPIFYAYKIDLLTGIAPPVISRAGYYRKPNSFEIGEMKVSKQFNRLALASSVLGRNLDIFDFDVTTGIVSNHIALDSSMAGYGVEFSSDGTRLYHAGGKGLIQYDLSAGSPVSILSSMYIVEKGSFDLGIRRGPDDMIYYCISVPANFNRVRRPNLSGMLCDYENDILKLPLPRLSATLGLGNQFVPHYLTIGDTSTHVIPRVMCEDLPLTIAAYGSKSYLWFDGDTAAVKTFTILGDYWVKKISACNLNIDTFKIRVQRIDTTYATKTDTSLCAGLSISALVPSDAEWHLWSDGKTDPVRHIKPTANLALLTRKKCSVTIDSFKVTETPIDTTYSMAKDTTICGADLLTISIPAIFREWYKWSDGDTSKRRSFSAPSSPLLISKYLCHYYFDSFRIREQVPELHQLSAIKEICSGSKILLSGRTDADQYRWNDADTANSKLFAGAGKVWVNSRKGCTFYIDTTIIREKLYTTSTATLDYTVCFKPSATITPPDTFHRYLWGSGNTGTDTTLSTAANIVVVATDTADCTIVKFNYKVGFVDFASTLADTFICSNEPVLLDAGIDVPSAIYRWSTGDTTAKIMVEGPETKFVSIEADGCSLLDTVHIEMIDLNFSIGKNQTLCKGEKVILESDASDAQYLWSSGETTRSIEVSETGTYHLKLTKGSCTVTREVHLSFVPCDACVFIPSAFTPNKDGINDRFKPILNCPPSSYQLKIMNRWGQEMFHSSSPNDAWDGSANGLSLEGNTYFYMLLVKFEAQGDKEEQYAGDITLIR